MLSVSNGGSGAATGFIITGSAVNCTVSNCLNGLTGGNGTASSFVGCNLTGTGIALGTGIITSSATATTATTVDGNSIRNFGTAVNARGTDLVILNHSANCTATIIGEEALKMTHELPEKVTNEPSKAEIEYQDKKSPAIFVRFELERGIHSASMVIWTTRPWTLSKARQIRFVTHWPASWLAAGAVDGYALPPWSIMSISG